MNKTILALLFTLVVLNLSACCGSPVDAFHNNWHSGKYDPAREERIKEIEETKWYQPPEIQRELENEKNYLEWSRNPNNNLIEEFLKYGQ